MNITAIHLAPGIDLAPGEHTGGLNGASFRTNSDEKNLTLRTYPKSHPERSEGSPYLAVYCPF